MGLPGWVCAVMMDSMMGPNESPPSPRFLAFEDVALAAAYGAAARVWPAGPDGVYRRLAQEMLWHSPVQLSGARVLDVGAGTGAASRAALAIGARTVVAADLSAGMLRAGVLSPVLPVVADACALPFRAESFDLVTAACCLGHLADPVLCLAEARRVARAVLATAFLGGWTHPAKSAIDEVMVRFGYVAPDWYRRLKAVTEPLVDDPDRFRALAVAAGWGSAAVTVRHVPTGLAEPAELVDWRWGMAHLAPFVANLDPDERSAARRSAESAVVGAGELVMPLLILAARR